MKYVSIRKPDTGPFGETLRDARVRAMVAALFVKSPLGGCVESVLTLDTHRLLFETGMHCAPVSMKRWSFGPQVGCKRGVIGNS